MNGEVEPPFPQRPIGEPCTYKDVFSVMKKTISLVKKDFLY